MTIVITSPPVLTTTIITPGAQGPSGAIGAKGDTGDTGLTGATGAKGDPGEPYASAAAQLATETARDTAVASASTASTQASNAAASAIAASGSASTAATSASTAATSATTANTKADEASTSATNAASSATTANTKAGEASTSASNAAGSASTATTQASNASTSASNAAGSATAASNSATAAAGSATAASNSATAASGSASTATTQAGNASTSATNAANSATAAGTSATNASNSASAASGSATSASGSATTATTQAGNAATSATNAANSAIAASGSATSASGSATTATTKAGEASASASAAAQSAIDAALNSGGVSDHINATLAAHAATAIANTPAGNIAATTVQAAINELDSEKAATGHNHDASYAPLSHVGTTGAAHGNASGSVAGFMTAADKTKLDAIEASATADQTAAEILTAIKTVDGAASGLDADLLDGMQPASINTVSTVVARDASGNFSAGTITANITGSVSGNAGTVTNGLYSNGSYADPAWLTSLSFSKLAATPTTLAGYGITDAQATITGAASTITTSNLTANRVLVANASGKVAAAGVTWATLLYLDATSSVQTQLDGKQASLGYTPINKGGDTMTGSLYTATTVNGVNHTGSTGVFEVMGSTTKAAAISFHRSGAYAVNMGLDTDNWFRIGGWSGIANAFELNPATGDLKISGDLTVASGQNDSWITMWDADQGNRAIHNNTNQIGFLTQAGGWGSWCDDDGNWTAAGNIAAYSDSRLKKDLEVIPNALDKVQQLTGYTFTRIDSGVRQTGLIAQDVQAVLPEAVDTSGEHLSLAYGNLVGLLVEAIKEQQKQIDELKAKVGV